MNHNNFQRTREWLETDDFDYHFRQFEEPYRSTVKFFDWLEDSARLPESPRILDLACGMGQNSVYAARHFSDARVLGMDINERLVEKGRAWIRRQAVSGVELCKGDLYAVADTVNNHFDAVLLLQTLSWLPDYQRALESISQVNTELIALSSLFYDGPVSCRIEVTDRTKSMGEAEPRKTFYNIYSIDEVTSSLRDLGYPNTVYTEFEIDCDLSPPEDGGMGTYTVESAGGRRIQFSGPLMLPWHFLMAWK